MIDVALGDMHRRAPMSEEPIYSLVRVETSPKSADAMVGRLMMLGAESIEERDDSTLEKGGGLGVTLLAGFADAQTAHDAVEALGPGASLETIVGDAWRDAWKSHWKAQPLCAGIVVVPSWVAYEPGHGEIVLRLDPGRAFGTGQHASTVLAAEAIARSIAEGPAAGMVDLGCGSGILAFAALLLGVERALGFDLDPHAVEAARENAEQTGLSSRVRFEAGGLDAGGATAALVVANIEAAVLVPAANVVLARVTDGGRLILSGILEAQRDAVIGAYEAQGAKLSTCPSRDGWVAPCFTVTR